MWRKAKGAPEAITEDVFRRIESSPDRLPPAIIHEVDRLAARYCFLHWHLAFPDVFRLPRKDETPQNTQAGWSGGFDVVLGNPPWERVKLQEKEWFAGARPDIASAPNAAARRKMITALAAQDPPLFAAWLDASRQAEGESHLIRNSDRYPLCGRGDINTYSIFAETKRLILGATGRVGCVVPTGIATDDTTKFFFRELVDSQSLVSVIGFENEEFIFPAVHNATKFCLLTMSGPARLQHAADFVFFAREVGDVQEQHRHFTLARDDIALLNPNTRTCPIFRSKRDAEITKAIHRRVPVLITEGPLEENAWGIQFLRMFDMANDSGSFRTREQLERDGWTREGNIFRRGEEAFLPLYEAKMVHHFDHRFGDYALKPPDYRKTDLPQPPLECLQDPSYAPTPAYWVPRAAVEQRLRGKSATKWDRGWLLGWRDVTGTVNERTVIATVIPRAGVGHTMPLMLLPKPTARLAPCLLANLSTFVLDYCARQKVGGTHLTYGYLNQLPVLRPDAYRRSAPWAPSEPCVAWILSRTLELTDTAWDLTPLARDCGYEGPPFRRDDARRFLLRSELDAAFFHLYGVSRDDVDYIMDTFPLVRKDDEARLGEYRTKRVILEIYDAMTKAIATGEPYQTIFDPPPADPRVTHPGVTARGT